jgi:hypothetical protein
VIASLELPDRARVEAGGGEIVLSAPDTITVSGPEGSGSLTLPGLAQSDSLEVWCGEGWCLLVGLQHPTVVAARPTDGEITVLGDVERLDLDGGYDPGGLERVEFHELPGGDLLVVTELSVARVSPAPAIVWQRTHDDLTARVERIDQASVWFDADGDRFGFDLDDGTDILR